ncbi:hypothetical protein IL306_005155 [Fusarium sp. DS 682]|nr:hypothetical protein IL306_005155 [Fusarium sp. DS 682]
MDRNSLPNGLTHPEPITEEAIPNGENAQDWGDFVDSDDEGDVEFVCEFINLSTLKVSAIPSPSVRLSQIAISLFTNSAMEASLLLRPLNTSISTKYKQIGRPRKMKLWTEQWKEGELVMPMKPEENLIGDTIVLGDFGLSHKAGTPAQKRQSPATYCAPERVHDTYPSYGSDI